MNLWQKLSIDWLCALGDWLWANLVVPVRAGCRQVTVRRVVYFAALLAAIYVIGHVATIDVAFWAAGDIAFYCEIMSAVFFVAVRGHARQMLYLARQKLAAAASRTAIVLRRLGARQRRNANALGRKRADSPPSDDEGAAFGWDFAPA